ncbi:uncharacterized protein BDV17DRAFT_80663 [Aspergillus undulatus]|uniref:uncharacterized protein n=1 Tax=Aspergillus undulatus TaxID=1810928 RepID=UPI003CCDBDEA
MDERKSTSLRDGVVPTAGDNPLDTPLDLGVLLSKWAVEQGLHDDLVGNVEHVENIVQTLKLCQRERLRNIFERAYAALEDPRADRLCSPFPATLGTFIICEIIRSPEAVDAMDKEMRERSGDGLLRYKIKVVQDSILWLSEPGEPRSHWVEKLIPVSDPYTENDVSRAFRWLREGRTEEFCEAPGESSLTKSEEADLNRLWRLFDGNEWLPIRFAFCLARLDSEREWPDRWSRLSRVLWPLYLGVGSRLNG